MAAQRQAARVTPRRSDGRRDDDDDRRVRVRADLEISLRLRKRRNFDRPRLLLAKNMRDILPSAASRVADPAHKGHQPMRDWSKPLEQQRG